MSERMTPISIDKLLCNITTEYKNQNSIFSVFKMFKSKEKSLSIFDEKIETPLGVAAGPNTQLAQNIVSAYVAGARFFELKTVQTLDGEDLAKCISRPCIKADDEGYNCEWSTELTVKNAMEEYIKAWCILKVISKAYSLGSSDGFVFNMSVGYDLDGIKSKKIDDFIEGLKNAEDTEIFKECKDALKKYFPDMSEYIDEISPKVCTSVTLSTLHGCPPDEIERIATYLISEKHLNTYVKCNPTILGYQSARDILDSMGYDYVAFDEHHFNEDLQYSDAVSMFKRLLSLAKENNLEFGLKLSNTFPVDVKQNELPSDEMYMSGKSLFPLTIEMANRISKEFEGKLRVSFSGGADFFNIDKLFDANIWPVTVATTILKPGGYLRLKQMAELLQEKEYKDFSAVDVEKVSALSENCRFDKHHTKPIKPIKSRKSEDKVPLFDCFTAPCMNGCPINQDIPQYIKLCEKGMYKEALRVITQKNPLPFITGTICAHNCMSKCTRNFYESSVNIRSTKLLAAENGYEELIKEIKPNDKKSDKKVAIIGGGVAGLSAAYFIAREGIEVTVFERDKFAGGIVRNVIPSFRISNEEIEKDIALIEKTGAKILTETEAPSVEELKNMGYTHIAFAIGAYKKQPFGIEGNVVNVIDFLRDAKSGKELDLGRSVAVIGGGNTAMDAARLAKRLDKNAKVSIVYRRTKRYMPADEEELTLALSDGVEFCELLAPIKQEDGKLLCSVMKLSTPDESGRQRPVDTGDVTFVDADTVIFAIGEKVESEIFTRNGIEVEEKGKVPFKTNVDGVYNIGDSLRGPSTVVECIKDAQRFADEVIGEKHIMDIPIEAFVTVDDAKSRKGILCDEAKCEGERCLNCNTVCENCVDVCPNRANVVITLPDKRREILHIDRMCNECGNCKSFCPYSSAPYKDKFTLFNSVEDFNDSENSGFVILDDKTVRVRLGVVKDYDIDSDNELYKDAKSLIKTVIENYKYLY
ncbi:MAG: putative selenate reductase subunit YgfK [Oscillospiraceae bacterium]|nr:putative selenate reductase subunit YgfK [Candidatus Ruminococcus equi]